MLAKIIDCTKNLDSIFGFYKTRLDDNDWSKEIGSRKTIFNCAKDEDKVNL